MHSCLYLERYCILCFYFYLECKVWLWVCWKGSIIFCDCPDASFKCCRNQSVCLSVCFSAGNLGGEIRSCQRWSRCCSTSSHQCSPTLQLTYSISASVITRSKLRFVSACVCVCASVAFFWDGAMHSTNIQTNRAFLLGPITPTSPCNTQNQFSRNPGEVILVSGKSDKSCVCSLIENETTLPKRPQLQGKYRNLEIK